MSDFDWTKNVNSSNPLEALRLLRGSSMAVIGTNLYIDGGEYYTAGFNGTVNSPDGPPDYDDNWAANEYLFTLDLTKRYPSRNFTDVERGMKAIKKNAKGWSSTIGGNLRTVGNLMYHAGGVQTHYKLDDGETALWTYDGFNFKSATPKGDVDALNTINSASAVSPDGIIYYYAGQAANGTALSNLVAWDTKQGMVDILSQENLFVTGSGNGIVGASIHWIPIGEKGSLVAFGGSLMNGADLGTTQGNPLTKAGIFDIANKKWYSQSLVTRENNDEFPRTRRLFTGVTPTPDKSQENWEILIYGGLSGEVLPGKPGDRYDDIWCLTLPSFQWMKFYTQNGGANFGKYNRSSTLVNDRLFVNLDQTPTNIASDQAGEDIFSMYDISGAKGFGDPGSFVGYDPTTKGYSTPLKVQVAISNPIKNDLTAGVGDLFKKSYYDPTNPSSPTGSPSSTNPSPSSTSSSTATPTSHTGAIAGGAVAGVAGLLLIAGLIFILFRRNKRRKNGNPHFESAMAVAHQYGSSSSDIDMNKAELPTIPPPPIYTNGAYQVVPQRPHEVHGDDIVNPAAELDTDRPTPAELPAQIGHQQ